MTRSWTLLTDSVGHPGWWQMALDAALLHRAEQTGEGVVRLYRWEPWCLSFGRNEPALRRYRREAITRLHLDTVRRPTGGRAVWHARELTYSVTAPTGWFGTLAESYRIIHQTLAAAIRSLGAPATLADAGETAGLDAGACFAMPVGGEVLVQGRKLLGSAQLRQGPAFLQHGSLLLEDDQRFVAELSQGEPPVGDEITLHEAAGGSIAFARVAQAIAAEVSAWGDEWREGQEVIDVAALVEAEAPRYRDPAWTWRR